MRSFAEWSRDQRKRSAPKGGHALALSLDHVPDRLLHNFGVKQCPRTPMTRPAFSRTILETHVVESSARSRLQLRHDEFGALFSLHDHVNVVGPDVSGKEPPIALSAAINECL